MTVELFRAPAGPATTSRWGAPAKWVPHGGMPAYESETGALFVMECLVATFHGMNAPLLLPLSYQAACVRAPTNLAALHDDPDAVWSWRPLIYTLKATTTERLGSQMELNYRIGVWQVVQLKADVMEELIALGLREGGIGPEEFVEEGKRIEERLYSEPLPYTVANEKARALLIEHLNPQQRLELARDNGFYVRGTINPLYYVDVGNGVAVVNPVTREPRVSICLHTDDWMPDEDVALASKLLIDSGKSGETELLAGGRARIPRRRPEPADDWDVRAWEIERHLLPTPYAEVVT